jgi:hypothetical protein
MVEKLKFPATYCIEVLLLLLQWIGLAITGSFFIAKPISSLDLQRKALPSSWEAAIPDHGQFIQAYFISTHPLLFALGLALLIAPGRALFVVLKAQLAQRENASTSGKNAHRIARFVEVTALLAASYFLYLQLVSIAPR